MFGMVPEHPKIDGLFTPYRQSYFFLHSIEPWYLNFIRDNPDTWHCSVVEVAWYKKQNGVKHEFLRFDISSPDKRHTCVVIAERNGGGGNANRDPYDTVPGPVTPLGATGDSTWGAAHDLIHHATLNSRTRAQLEQMFKKATRVCSLTFSEKARPSANELATLLYLTSKLEPTYTVTSTQCYWFVETVFTALKSLFEDAEQDIAIHRGGTWNGVPVYTKASVKEQIEQRQWVRARAAEEIAQREREKRLAAEQKALAAEQVVAKFLT
ncbi:hypothetical protein EDD16DRAFT_1526648 [Pisolithus croceorrhizus]|nr:hypothetical protein EDD16DRAFT_1526648 [Pisolithus croceorrhizus]